MRLNESEYTKIIDAISKDACPGLTCLLKLMIIKLHPDPRLLLQLKCIEKLSSSKLELAGDAAISVWINDGYAEAFAQAYREAEVRFLEQHVIPEFDAIYNRILELAASPKQSKKGLDFKI